MSIGLAIFLVAIIGFAIYSRGFRRAALITVAVIAGGLAFLLYNGSTQGYRECVALMWDRKHPAEVRQQHVAQAEQKCNKVRLSNGVESRCIPREIVEDCQKMAQGVPDYKFDWHACIENVFAGGKGDAENPCERLSLEELRRADAEASRDQPPR